MRKPRVMRRIQQRRLVEAAGHIRIQQRNIIRKPRVMRRKPVIDFLHEGGEWLASRGPSPVFRAINHLNTLHAKVVGNLFLLL
jgi:hypothetical protein